MTDFASCALFLAPNGEGGIPRTATNTTTKDGDRDDDVNRDLFSCVPFSLILRSSFLIRENTSSLGAAMSGK